MSVTMGDFDNDGLVDLHTNEWLPHFLRSKQPDGSFASHARLLRNGAAGKPGFFEDVTEAAGGFVAISGSQRANYPTPEGLMQSDPQGSIQHIAAPAGSAILFNGGATAHGAWGWTGREGRRAIIVNYLSRFIEYPRF